MKVEKKDLGKSQVELLVEVSIEEMKPFIERAVENISKEVKVDGFRPGKVPADVLKKKIGEMSIMEEAARVAIDKTIDQAIRENLDGAQLVGQPQVDVVKLAPDNAFEYKLTIAILPEVKLGEYKGLKIKEEKIEVKEEEIAKMIDNLRDMNAPETETEEVAKDGDKVLVDINMFLGNVPVENGQSKGSAVVIGKNYVVPGFDKELIGLKKGDEKEFKLPYPAEHHMKNLAGKLVEFKIKVVSVFHRELPEVGDELAKKFGMKNIDELKGNIRQTMEHEKHHEMHQKTEIQMIEKILETAKFGDIPEILVRSEGDQMMHELQRNVEQYGGKMEDYMSSIGKTREQLLLEMLPEAVKRVKTSLMIREVALLEKIEVTDQDVETEIANLIKHYQGNAEVEQAVKKPEYRKYLANTIASRKVMNKLHDWNIEGCGHEESKK